MQIIYLRIKANVKAIGIFHQIFVAFLENWTLMDLIKSKLLFRFVHR